MGSDRVDEGAVRRALAEAGHVAASLPLWPGFRNWRWLTLLPGGRLAFFADDPEAVARLARERALLDLLGRRVRGFAVPTVEHVSPDGRLQVRRMVEGAEWPGSYGRERALAASSVGRRFAGELGRAFAELRGRFPDGLPEPALEPVLDAVLDRCAALDEGEGGRVLTHGDPGLHNMAIDLETGRLLGMFDLEEAALDDRHADLYGLHSYGDAFVGWALDASTRPRRACSRRSSGRRCTICSAPSRRWQGHWRPATRRWWLAGSAGCTVRSPTRRAGSWSCRSPDRAETLASSRDTTSA